MPSCTLQGYKLPHSLKEPLHFSLFMGQYSFLLTVLAFRCPLSVYPKLTVGVFLWSVPGAFRLVTTLRLTSGPAGNRTTTGSLSTPYKLLHRDASKKLTVGMRINKKHTFLAQAQPTNPDPRSLTATSVQNKQPAPNASNLNNESTQTGVKKFSSSKRTPTRSRTLVFGDKACFIMAPKTGSKKLETWRP